MPKLLSQTTYVSKSMRSQQGSAVEFNLSLLILFVIFLFPMINLVCISIACAGSFLVAMQAAQAASTRPTYARALNAAAGEAANLNSNGLMKMVKMSQTGGFNNTGIDLYVHASNLNSSGNIQVFGPNTPVSAAVDPSQWVYEYVAKSTYTVDPFVSFATVPLLKDIPGLGKPFVLSFTAARAAEYPLGLMGDGANIAYSGGSTPLTLKMSGLEIPGDLTDTTNSPWNRPRIYQDIKAAGQTIKREEVLIVNAKNDNWTDSQIDIAPGEKVWIDYRADGIWSVEVGIPQANSDADGLAGSESNPQNTSGFPYGSMVGKIGSSNNFFLGKSMYQVLPPGTGRLFLANNDGLGPGFSDVNYGDNQGLMTVRIIITN